MARKRCALLFVVVLLASVNACGGAERSQAQIAAERANHAVDEAWGKAQPGALAKIVFEDARQIGPIEASGSRKRRTFIIPFNVGDDASELREGRKCCGACTGSNLGLLSAISG